MWGGGGWRLSLGVHPAACQVHASPRQHALHACGQASRPGTAAASVAFCPLAGWSWLCTRRLDRDRRPARPPEAGLRMG